MTNLLILSTQVLGRPAELIALAEDPHEAGRQVPPLIALILLGAGLFGLAVGSFHSPLQAVYAAIKMPLVLLIPLGVALPALRAIHADEENAVPLARAGFAGLVGCARIAILASALAPVVWLVYSLDPPYAIAVLGMAMGLGLVGLPGLATIGRSMVPNGGWRASHLLMTVCLVGGLIAQSGWLLRPFVVTPGARLSFHCPVQDDILGGLAARAGGRIAVDEQGIPVDCAP